MSVSLFLNHMESKFLKASRIVVEITVLKARRKEKGKHCDKKIINIKTSLDPFVLPLLLFLALRVCVCFLFYHVLANRIPYLQKVPSTKSNSHRQSYLGWLFDKEIESEILCTCRKSETDLLNGSLTPKMMLMSGKNWEILSGAASL